MKANLEIPQAVKDWVKNHKGFRVPIYQSGMYKSYIHSTTSCCWGSNGGIKVDKYRIVVCQPSPISKDDKAYFYYDFIEETN